MVVEPGRALTVSTSGALIRCHKSLGFEEF